jgi:hypothetical protein
MLAAQVGSGQAKMSPQESAKGEARLDPPADLTTIHRQSDRNVTHATAF